MVADLFQVVVPSISASFGLPTGIRTESVAQDVLVIDVVHGTTIEGRPSAQNGLFHQRNTNLPPAAWNKQIHLSNQIV